MRESCLYQKLPGQSVQCRTCCHYCALKAGERGKCGARKNIDGKLYALNYGRAPGLAIDPIEKKPLYHFLPGTYTLSFNARGCNFRCAHCQNYWTSQVNESSIINYESWGEEISPEEIVKAALDNNCPSIAYTYTEPTVFLEYALDTMKLARQKNLKNVWVSNGFMSGETLNLIAPYLDAANIDLKGFAEKFYADICGARLRPVLDNLIKINQLGIYLEVTTLIIPTLNDSAKELRQIADFIKTKLSPDTPWHVSAFYPAYKLQHLPPTLASKILEAQTIGLAAGLRFVHTGNM